MALIEKPELQTPPPARFYLPHLDGLRAIAFLLVWLHHLPPARFLPSLAGVQRVGWLGVELFFALSSFLLLRLMKMEREQHGTVSVLHFYLRRVLRIWPLYLTYCAGAFGLALTLLRKPTLTPEHALGRLVGLVTFTDNLFAWVDGLNPIPATGHLWTLSFEEQVYAVMPAVFLLTAATPVTRMVKAVGCVAAIGLLLRLGFVLLPVNVHSVLWGTPWFRLDSVLLGALLGLFGAETKHPLLRTPVLLTAAGACLAALLVMPPIHHDGFHQVLIYPVAALFCGTTLAVVLRPQEVPGLHSALSVRPMRYLGKISYGLYLFHFGSITVCQRLLTALGVYGPGRPTAVDWVVLALSSLVLTLAVSALSYRFIESPALRLKERFSTIRSRPV